MEDNYPLTDSMNSDLILQQTVLSYPLLCRCKRKKMYYVKANLWWLPTNFDERWKRNMFLKQYGR